MFRMLKTPMISAHSSGFHRSAVPAAKEALAVSISNLGSETGAKDRSKDSLGDLGRPIRDG